jgi:hypothetical protein
MVRFLYVKRRQGKPIRWIAQKLGVTLVRAVAMAVNRGLVLHTVYRGREGVLEPDIDPFGPEREIAGEGLCRWIPEDPREPWHMCARPAEGDGPWCAFHKARALAPRKGRRPGTAGVLARSSSISNAPRDESPQRAGGDARGPRKR